MNNLFRGIPFSHEEKLHEYIQHPTLLAVSARFCRLTKGAFCGKSPISIRRNDRLKPGSKLLNLRGPLHETRHETHAGMSFIPAPVFISGAGLSYSCVYMLSGRYETFISGPHEIFMSPFHAGMKMG